MKENGWSSRTARWTVPLALLALAAGLVEVTRQIERRVRSPLPVARALPYTPGMAALALAGVGHHSDAVTGDVPLELPLSSGQTIGSVLAELELSPAEANRIIAELSEFADLRRLKPEDGYAVVFAGDTGRVAAFDLNLSARGRVRVARQGDDWSGSYRAFERRSEPLVVRGTLEGALESSIERAGGDARLAVLMSEVFQWDLDFNRDLRLGDTFDVLYEQVLIDGSYRQLGQILAVHYTNRGRTIEAYRFGDPAGYYDAEGRPLRKMFLRSPMRYSRITSRYSNRRFHPVLKRYRPHYGVDYGAPTGTPVRVTASGVVSFAGWEGGGGRMIKVRHPNGYLTAYLHLSRFASGIKPGRRVRQGETIGYVGATGLASGPHLDYRVQKHGKWIDPLSLKSVPADPIPPEQLAAFAEWRQAFRSTLAEGRPSAELLRLQAKPEADGVQVATVSGQPAAGS